MDAVDGLRPRFSANMPNIAPQDCGYSAYFDGG